MKRHAWLLPLFGCCFCYWEMAGSASADSDTLPVPRLWNAEEAKQYAPGDFEQLIERLKRERAALQTEWQALVKRSTDVTPKGDTEAQFQTQLQDALRRLRDSRYGGAALESPPQQHPLDAKAIAPLPGPQTKKTDEPTHAARAEDGNEAEIVTVDVLSQGQSLFKSHRFEEALACFRQVDLKGKKAETRAPVQYLTALCLMHLGKAEDALPILREVANSRGDEKTAGYAQWQLDMYRWERELRGRLGQAQQRRQAVEQKAMTETLADLEQRLTEGYRAELRLYDEAIALVTQASSSLSDWTDALHAILGSIGDVDRALTDDKAYWRQAQQPKNSALSAVIAQVGGRIAKLDAAVKEQISALEARRRRLMPEVDEFIQRRRMLAAYGNYGDRRSHVAKFF